MGVGHQGKWQDERITGGAAAQIRMDTQFNRSVGPAEKTEVAIENGFDFKSDEYRSLYAASNVTGFQSPLWLDRLYGVLVPALTAEPLILTVRSNGNLEAVIPLVVQKVTGITVLQAADLGVSDYNAPICTEATLAELAASTDVRAALAAKIRFADVLFMRKVTGNIEAIDRLLGGTARSASENNAYVIDLMPGEFDSWRRENLKKGFRKNIDRRRRRLTEEHDQVKWQTFVEPEDVIRAIEFIREERGAKFKDDILANDAYFEFYKACAVAGAAGGETVTSGVVVDGQLAAADFGVMGKDCLHSILCAADVDNFGQYAPGIQSLHDLIWERSDQGDTRFDAGIGNSRYKSDFSAREIGLENISLALSAKGQAVSAIYHRAKPLKNFLRNIVKTVH